LSNKKYKSHKVKEKAFMNFLMIDWAKVLANEGNKKAKEYMNRILNDL